MRAAGMVETSSLISPYGAPGTSLLRSLQMRNHRLSAPAALASGAPRPTTSGPAFRAVNHSEHQNVIGGPAKVASLAKPCQRSLGALATAVSRLVEA